MDLPQYLPLRKEYLREFEKLTSRASEAKHTDSLLTKISNQTTKYIDYSLKSKSELKPVITILKENLKCLEALIRAQYDVSIYKNSIEDSRKSIRKFQASDNELTLDNLEHYQNVSSERENFADLIQSDYERSKGVVDSDRFNELLYKNPQYKTLLNLVFILENPETPIPDTNQEEDLNISGGKISLRDPISLDYFKNPVISKKCRHTFDKEIMEVYLQTNNDCPIAGCKSKIALADLIPDKEMSIRVIVFSQNLKIQGNVTRLE